MIFADLLAGEAIFLDANTLVYHFVSDPVYGAACSQLLQRIENQEIQGLTSTHILTEMAHRIMTIEAIGAFKWPLAGIARRLKDVDLLVIRDDKGSRYTRKNGEPYT